MELEKRDELLTFLDSSLADFSQSASNKTFRLNPQLKINNDEVCFVNLTDFNMLNSVYNVTDSNNSFIFNGTTHLVTPGYYSPSELAGVLDSAFTGLSVVFDKKTLKYRITSTPTTSLFITGTLLPILGMSNSINNPADTVWTSYKIPDEITSQNDILFTIANLNTKNQMIGAKNIPNLIDKVPIQVNFSEFIAYTNYTNKSTQVLSDNINDLNVRLLSNKLRELEINNVSWVCTLKFTIYKKTGEHFIEKSLTSKEFSPVVHSLNTREFINQKQHDLENKRDRFWISKKETGETAGRSVSGVDFNNSAPNRQNSLSISTMETLTPSGKTKKTPAPIPGGITKSKKNPAPTPTIGPPTKKASF